MVVVVRAFGFLRNCGGNCIYRHGTQVSGDIASWQ
jgi:hypothetical protein